jgi:hypothetical protein
MSDATTEKFIVSMAEKGKSENDIFDRLIDADFPVAQTTRSFAKQLYDKYGIKGA